MTDKTEWTVSDEKLTQMLDRVSPPAEGWQAGLPTLEVHSIITELQQLRYEHKIMSEFFRTIIPEGQDLEQANSAFAWIWMMETYRKAAQK